MRETKQQRFEKRNREFLRRPNLTFSQDIQQQIFELRHEENLKGPTLSFSEDIIDGWDRIEALNLQPLISGFGQVDSFNVEILQGDERAHKWVSNTISQRLISWRYL